MLMLCIELDQYGTVSTQSISMCGGYWEAVFAPVMNNVFNQFDFGSDMKSTLEVAKIIGFVTSVVHCFNEVVMITLVKYLAISRITARIASRRNDGNGSGAGDDSAREDQHNPTSETSVNRV